MQITKKDYIFPPFQGKQALVVNTLIAFIAAIFIVWGLWRASLPMEISRNESWDAWHISAILSGNSPYSNDNELVVNNYPPLSFYFVALISKFTSDVIYTGRFVSILSTFTISLVIFLCIRAFGFSRAAAAFGALWFLGTAAHFFWTYFLMCDPNMLALAIMGLSLVLFLQRASAGKPVEPAIAGMVLAGFFKHNIIVIPFVSIIWLLRIRWQLAVRAAAFGVILAAVGIAICIEVYGTTFLDQLLMPRAMSFGRALTFFSPRVGTLIPLLCVWAYWAYLKRSEPAAKFSALLIASSFVAAFLQRSGDGVGSNAWLELLIAASIGGGMAIEGVMKTPLAESFGPIRTLWVIVAVLSVRLVLEGPEPYSLYVDHAYREQARNSVRVMNSEIARVKEIPGPVTCIRHLVICYRAGKAYVFDDFAASQLVAAKLLTEEALNQRIAGLKIRFEKIDDAVGMKKLPLF